MAFYSKSDEFINLLEKILKDMDEIKKSIDETFKENEDEGENHVEEATQVDEKKEDRVGQYVIPNESNGINQYNMQYKDIAYPSDKGIENEIIDKEKDDPDQDCDKRQANVANNKDDQCCDKNVTITNTQRTDLITKTAIKNIKGTDTKCVGDNNTKIVKVVMYVHTYCKIKT